MEINILEDKKNKFIFEVEGMGYTFLNLLKHELWNDKNVKVATFSVRHPIISKPKIIVETDGSESPRSAMTSAVTRLKKHSEKFKKDIAKEIK